MSEEALENFLTYRKIMLDTKKFLEKNSNSMINIAIDQTNISEKYKNDILKAITKHFQWIMEHCENSTVNFREYNIYANPSDYSLIYKNLLQQIENLPISTHIKENLEDYFTFLKKEFI